jgi:hypothetical protein
MARVSWTSTRQVKAGGIVDDVQMYGAMLAAFRALQPDSGLYALSSARPRSEVNTYGVGSPCSQCQPCKVRIP